MSHQNAHAEPNLLTRDRPTALRILLMAAAVTLLTGAAIALMGTNVAEIAAAGLIHGPLIEGPVVDQSSPLIDLGGVLTDNQSGQFQ